MKFVHCLHPLLLSLNIGSLHEALLLEGGNFILIASVFVTSVPKLVVQLRDLLIKLFCDIFDLFVMISMSCLLA